MAAFLLVLMSLCFSNYIERPWEDNYWRAENEYLVPCESGVIGVARIFGYSGTVYYYYPVMDDSLEELRLDETKELIRGKEILDVEENIDNARSGLETAERMRDGMQSVDLVYYIITDQPHICLEAAGYGDAWINTMDKSMDALELSIEDAQNSVDAAEDEYEKIMHTGICDEGYTWAPADACDDIVSAGTIMESGSIEGDYGKINLLYEYAGTLNEELDNDAPNTTLYYPIMELVWGEEGIIVLFNDAADASKTAREAAGGIYDSYKDQADTAKKHAEESFSELKSHNPEKITVPVAMDTVDETRIGTIKERYGTIEDEKDDIERTYDDAEDMFSNTWTQGYLKEATIGMSYAKDSYDSLADRMEVLLEDAGTVVDDAREEAQDAIDEAEAKESTMGTSGKENLDAARDAFEDGEKSSKLGDQYEDYVEALTYARLAAGDKSYYEEQEINLKIAEVRELISKAETDDIDVTSEEEELDLLEDNKDLPDIMQRLDSLKNRIIGKAEMQYLYLQDEHDELYEMLSTAEADGLLDDMETAETGIVFSGIVNYGKGLGRLKELASDYEQIREDFEENLEDMNDLVANSIVTDASLVMGKVNIDEPTDLTLNVLFVNKKDYAGTDVEVRVEVPGKFKFDYFDITKGTEDVVGLSASGYRLDIMLGSIDAFETKSVTFEKSQVLATTESEEESAAGTGDGSAKIEKSIVFDLEVENAYVAVPESWATGVSIDGISAKRPLSKGVHTLSMSYTVDDAYTEERGETIATYTGETETTVTYPITVTPDMDLDSVPVVADVGDTEQLTDVDISCVEYACDVEGTKVEIFNLKEGSPATVQVSYTVSDLENYVKTELDRFSDVKEPELVVLYESAESMYSLGNYKVALTKMEELKKKSSEIDKDKSKLMRKYSEMVREIENEVTDLNTALGKADELEASNSSMIDLFSSRRTELSGILELAGNISSGSTAEELQAAVDTLDSVDNNWLKKQVKSYLKDATRELEDYREEFVEFENQTADELLETLEHDLNVLAATEKAESAVVVIADLEAIDEMLDGMEEELRVETEALGIDFEALKEEVETVLSDYSRESKSAKGTSIKDIFTVSESSVNRLISDIEKSIGEKTNEYIEDKMDDLEKKKKSMEDILEEAETQAEGRLKTIKSVFSSKQDSIPEDDRSFISGEITEMEQMIAAGNYAEAITKGDVIIERINKSQKDDSNFLVLLLASILVLAMVIIYMIRQQKPKKPKIKLQKEHQEKKEEKEKK